MRFRRPSSPEPSGRVRELEAGEPDAPIWQGPWPLLTVLAAVATAGAGWLLVFGYCVLGWIMAPTADLSAVLRLGTQGWLLANGTSVAMPGAQLSLMPLGLTGVLVALGITTCHHVTRHTAAPESVDGRLVRATLLFAVSYLVPLAAVRAWAEGDRVANSSLVGPIGFALALGFIGFARALDWTPRRIERWWRPAVRAISLGIVVMLVAGTAALVVAIWSGWERVVLLHEALEPGTLGTVMLVLGQLAWLPNLILWAGAWAIGSGVQLGVDTIISPAQSQVGMLPTVQVFGAVPVSGPMPVGTEAWVLSGVVAGAVAAWVWIRALLSDARADGNQLELDVAVIAGAGIGIVTGLVFAALQIPASGDIGVARLVDLGARFQALLVMAPTSMGLAGMATGLLLAWRAGSRSWASLESSDAGSEPGGAEREDEGEDEVTTRVIDG